MAVVIPELFSEAVNARMETSLRIGKVAFDATSIAENIKECGDTIHFPVVDRIGKAVTMKKGDKLEAHDLSMTDNVAKVKMVGDAVKIYDIDKHQVKANLVDLFAEQLGDAMAEAVDSDLVNEMDNSAAYKTPTSMATTITALEMEAGFDVFGDDIADTSFAGIIINSRLRSAIKSFEQFSKMDYSWSKNGNGVVTEDGIIGHWNGIIPVIICDNGTFDEDLKECKTYIVKKNALGIIWQKEASTEEERDTLYKRTILSADELYAVKLLNAKGVSILRKTITATTTNTDNTDTAESDTDETKE